MSPVRWPEVDELLRGDYEPEQLGGCAYLLIGVLAAGMVLAAVAAYLLLRAVWR